MTLTMPTTRQHQPDNNDLVALGIAFAVGYLVFFFVVKPYLVP